LSKPSAEQRQHRQLDGHERPTRNAEEQQPAEQADGGKPETHPHAERPHKPPVGPERNAAGPERIQDGVSDRDRHDR
jgi:hypothetical protein